MKIALNMKAKLTLWYLLIMVVTLAFFASLAYFLMAAGLVQKNILPVNMRLVQAAAGNNGETVINNIMDVSEQYLEKQSSGSLLSIKHTGEFMLNEGFHDKLVFNEASVTLTVNYSSLVPPGLTADQNVQIYVYPSPDVEGEYDILVLTQSAVTVNKPLQVFKNILLIVIPLTIIVSGILWLLLVKKILYPMESLAQVIRGFKEDDLDRRLKVSGSDEAGKLAESFNQMFARLEAAFKREKSFAADASHELRLPLNIIHGETSLALRGDKETEEYKELLVAISQKTEYMAGLLRKLSFLSRDDSNIQLTLEEINLADFLSEVTEDMMPLCETKKLKLRLDLKDTLVINGDVTLLRELFFNLIENAVKYTPKGGEVTVTVGRDKKHATISVKDTGIGIPAKAIPHIFDRFYRVDKTGKDGMGLGLSICKRIVELHRGNISIESVEEQGSNFILRLPISKIYSN